MANYIATVSPEALGNWDICKREGLWGVLSRSVPGVASARGVVSGDRIFVWLGKPKRGTVSERARHGIIALLVAVGPYTPVSTGVTVPWPNPSDYAGVFRVRLLHELESPEPDTFPTPRRVGVRFGFNNMALNHGFRPVEDAVATRLDALFPTSSVPSLGTPYATPPRPSPVSPAEPFDVDPDLIDRALAAHHETVDRLARWVISRGFSPRLPIPGEPLYDLGWFEGDMLFVAEVKSITSANEEQQLRLGLGQVLRYREQLRRAYPIASDVRALLVPEREPSDTSWDRTCESCGVDVLVPSP
jgi:hypothetical protein